MKTLKKYWLHIAAVLLAAYFCIPKFKAWVNGEIDTLEGKPKADISSDIDEALDAGLDGIDTDITTRKANPTGSMNLSLV
jgi:hypothetical protein